MFATEYLEDEWLHSEAEYDPVRTRISTSPPQQRLKECSIGLRGRVVCYTGTGLTTKFRANPKVERFILRFIPLFTPQ